MQFKSDKAVYSGKVPDVYVGKTCEKVKKVNEGKDELIEMIDIHLTPSRTPPPLRT